MSIFGLQIAFAAGDYVDTVVYDIKQEIVYPVILLLFGIALVVFLWGVVRFIWSEEDSEERKKGRMHMLWGIVGIAIMLAAVAIVIFIYNTVVDYGGDTGYDNKPIPKPSVVERGRI